MVRAGRRRARGGWRVYFLRCGDGSLYAGATNDMVARLARHAAGKGARYTRSRLPVTLVYEEPVRGRSAALRREAALKRLTRKEKLALVAADAARRDEATSSSPLRRGSSPPIDPSPLPHRGRGQGEGAISPSRRSPAR